MNRLLADSKFYTDKLYAETIEPFECIELLTSYIFSYDGVIIATLNFRDKPHLTIWMDWVSLDDMIELFIKLYQISHYSYTLSVSIKELNQPITLHPYNLHRCNGKITAESLKYLPTCLNSRRNIFKSKSFMHQSVYYSDHHESSLTRVYLDIVDKQYTVVVFTYRPYHYGYNNYICLLMDNYRNMIDEILKHTEMFIFYNLIITDDNVEFTCRDELNYSYIIGDYLNNKMLNNQNRIKRANQ